MTRAPIARHERRRVPIDAEAELHEIEAQRRAEAGRADWYRAGAGARGSSLTGIAQVARAAAARSRQDLLQAREVAQSTPAGATRCPLSDVHGWPRHFEITKCSQHQPASRLR